VNCGKDAHDGLLENVEKLEEKKVVFKHLCHHIPKGAHINGRIFDH
jgi:aspartate/tyrosine/aromatic aminotransferase